MTPEAQRACWNDRIALCVLVLVAFFVRARDLEAFFVGPDEGNYLYSARVHELERSLLPLDGLRHDSTWVAELASKYEDEVETYQHSYLHQWATRWLYRAGFGALEALRMSSLLCGVLCVVFVWRLWGSVFPGARLARFAVAASIAVHPLLVFYARTGWGQIGFTSFYVAYAGLLYHVLARVDAHDVRAFRRAGWLMLVTSVLAFGWQENVAPYVVASGFAVLAAPLFVAGPGSSGGYFERLFSRRTWTYAWSAVPVGAATLALWLWSPFANKYWFDAAGRAGFTTWGELKRATLNDVFVSQRLDLLLGWSVVALAPLGFVVLWKRERAFALYLAVTVSAGTALLFFLFGDAMLVRAHMPTWLVLVVFAAEGAVALGARFASPIARAAPLALLLASFASVSWTTSFGRVESPLFVGHLYARGERANVDYRRPDEPLLAHLRAHRRPDQMVAVYWDKGPIFRLQDEGIRAREFTFTGERATWPHWILGVERIMKEHGRTQEQGGVYKVVARDTIGRHALYEITDAP